MVEDGAMHGGPPCSSWIWMNRGTSSRSKDNAMGDGKQPSVVEANATLKLKLESDILFLINKDI